jgi:serine/threonine protein phosphatase PrpC
MNVIPINQINFDSENNFIEVGNSQKSKDKQNICGDVFFTQKPEDEDRIICVLSDGLGSGIKASVLATLTATMAAKFIISNMEIQKAAEVVLDTLPICSERKIAYSTFTIVDIDSKGNTRIVEFDNPPFILIRKGKAFPVEKKILISQSESLGEVEIKFSEFKAEPEDRIVFVSDGVIQSGMGSDAYPMGWGLKNFETFIEENVRIDPSISALKLSEKIVNAAYKNNNFRALDDITCGIVYFRKPRNLIVFTGPPYESSKDKLLKEIVEKFNGNKIIAGGTTAKIIARELNREMKINLKSAKNSIPPYSEMEGVDLITEGTITLNLVAENLQNKTYSIENPVDAVNKFILILLESDIIHFIVGTRINEAHQDPTLPESLDIRRNIIKRIAASLETQYLKKVKISFI